MSEQEKIMSNLINLWEQQPIDPTKQIQTKIADKITKQVGAAGNATEKLNPTKVVNKATLDAAAENPVAAQDALNKNEPQKMKKKMKKEHHLLTFEEYRERLKK